MLRNELIQKGLSNRECEISELMAKGLNNKEIANHLYVTEKTIRFHYYNINKKLHNKSGTRAVLINKLLMLQEGARL